MSPGPAAAVVVGIDGSTSALAAVALATREAAVRNRPLRIVHAFIWPLLHVPLGPSPAGPPDGGLRHEAERALATAIDLAHTLDPGVTVTGAVVDGAPAATLIRESHDAALIVLGSRGLGGFTGLLVGSVAVQVTAHAGCPVLVTKDDDVTAAHEPAGGPVVVAVDDYGKSEAAVGFAVEEAAWRGTDLVAVHAWTHPEPAGPGDILLPVFDITQWEADSRRMLAESVAGWAERYPQVKLTQRLVRGRPGRVLVEESTGAQLLVVGSRGAGGFTGLMLGSVSHAALHHARCPVAVVRAPADTAS